MSTTARSEDDAPMLRVVHGGDPGPEALAALVVALSSAAPTSGATAQQRSGWADRRSMLRGPLEHGPGRWVASARPAG